MNVFDDFFFTESWNCYITHFFLHHVACCFIFLNNGQKDYKNLKMRRDLMPKSHPTTYAKDRKLHLKHP